MRRASSQRAGRSRSWRALFSFFLFLLPGLVAGPALGGVVVWFHAHGPDGDHVHLLTKHAHHDPLAARPAQHDAQHRHGHEDEPERDEPAPHGLQLELPHFLATSGRDTVSGAQPGIHLPASLPRLRWALVLGESVCRHDLFRSGWPPQRARRSGVAGLLRSSHAILI